MSDLLEIAAELGYTPESAERLYREYQQARDNGNTAGQIHSEGWCGELIDVFSDRYYEEQKEYERAMACRYEGLPTMDEKYAQENPRR